MKRSLLIVSLLLVSLIPLSAQTTSPTSSRSMLAKENLKEYFSHMFFDAGQAAEFNIVVDNIVAGYIGNRRLRQTIDYVKDQTNTGVCVRCFINSDHRWAKVLNFKTPRGNCDTTNGTPSIVFQIALSPLGTGKLAEYQPSISYRVVNGYDPQLKKENIEAFEKYLRDTLPPMTRKEFFPKLNNQLVTALLKLMGSAATPVMVELKPQNAWGYDNYPSPAIYYSYEKAQIHGKEKFIYWASIPKGQVLKIQGHVEQPLMDSTTMERMLQLKRNSSVQQNFSTKDSLPKFDVSGFSTGDNTVKAVYQLEEGKGLDILAGQLNVAAYKQEKIKLIIVPIKGTQFTDGTGLQAALDNIYRQAVVNWEVMVDNSFTYTQDIHINPESNSQDPYDQTMDKVIAAYRKTDGYSRRARIIFLIDKFSSGLAAEIGYMPFYDQFGFVKQTDRYGAPMTTVKLARWIAHELGHGAFGLRHTFDPQVGLAENYGNLMDYTDSTRLCKFQWDIIHDSDAGEKEFGSADEVMAVDVAVTDYIYLEDKDYAYPAPSGVAIKIRDIKSGMFNQDGGLIRFKLKNDETYHGFYSKENGVYFYGYILEEYTEQAKGVWTKEAQAFFDTHKYNDYQLVEKDDKVYTIQQSRTVEKYLKCLCEYEWKNPKKGNSISGAVPSSLVPSSAILIKCHGTECSTNLTEVKQGVGYDLYQYLSPIANNEAERIQLRDMANTLTQRLNGKKFALYGYGLEHEKVVTRFTTTALDVFKELGLKNIEKFDSTFRQLSYAASDCDIILSIENLWEGLDHETYNAASVDWTSYTIPPITNEAELFEALERLEFVVTEIKTNYPDAISQTSYDNLLSYISDCSDDPSIPLIQKFNLNQTFKSIYAYLGAYQNYEYRFADLRTRQELKKSNSVFWTHILNFESKGAAAPISSANGYQQYVAYYGTESAYFLGLEYQSMIGITYSLYGMSQAVNAAGNALRGIVQQRGALKLAISKNNLLNSKIDYNARLANNQRLAQDIKYQQLSQQKRGGKATNTKDWAKQKIGKSAKQNQMKDELCERIENKLDAKDIRVNQTQSNSSEQGVGINRPDIAPLYDKARYYIEIDAVTSNRGSGHLQRIIANDPSAASGKTPIEIENIVKDVCLKYNCNYTITGRVILIQQK